MSKKETEISAIVLVKIKPGISFRDVGMKIAQGLSEQALGVYNITGPYDIAILISKTDPTTIDSIVDQVRTMKEIKDTVTSIPTTYVRPRESSSNPIFYHSIGYGRYSRAINLLGYIGLAIMAIAIVALLLTLLTVWRSPPLEDVFTNFMIAQLFFDAGMMFYAGFVMAALRGKK